MKSGGLFHNIRFYLLLSSFCISILAYLSIITTIPQGNLQIIRLTQIYALTAIIYLYSALLTTPLTKAFPDLPFRAKYIVARRSLGLSAFYFATLHVYFAFFGQLGGFGGLPFLSNTYLLAISLSFTSFLILFLMSITSFDFMIKKLTYKKWKLLHRFIYLAAFLILIHALMLGTHFTNLSDKIPQLFFIALFFLLFLEAIRFDIFCKNKFPKLPTLGITTVFITSIMIAFFTVTSFPSTESFSFGIHTQHQQLAQQMQAGQVSSIPNNLNNLQNLKGDKTKRFSVSFNHIDQVAAKENTNLRFTIFDANNGNRIRLFQKLYSKPMHLIIVNSDLSYFSHIHPEQKENGFAITTQFPKEDTYHLYADFQPFNAIEQQFAFTLPVGSNITKVKNERAIDTSLTKVFEAYEVTLSFPQPLLASNINNAKTRLTFTIKDALSKKPITTLKPYLDAFGHLVMIRDKTFDYIHVHPYNTTVPKENIYGGPVVEFLPMGLYNSVKPGTYKVFAEFNPDGNLFTADFTIEVE